jgi:hypothetical protein
MSSSATALVLDSLHRGGFMNQQNWPAAIVALGFLGLLGVMFWRATGSGDFTTIWASVGTVVGVVVGAIPSYFFKTQADAVRGQADRARKRAELYAGAMEPQAVQKVHENHPELF